MSGFKKRIPVRLREPLRSQISKVQGTTASSFEATRVVTDNTATRRPVVPIFQSEVSFSASITDSQKFSDQLLQTLSCEQKIEQEASSPTQDDEQQTVVTEALQTIDSASNIISVPR